MKITGSVQVKATLRPLSSAVAQAMTHGDALSAGGA
jgi:hypothetical protein